LLGACASSVDLRAGSTKSPSAMDADGAGVATTSTLLAADLSRDHRDNT
jgi:hypothetical protein